jgi:hypothetical protein
MFVNDYMGGTVRGRWQPILRSSSVFACRLRKWAKRFWATNLNGVSNRLQTEILIALAPILDTSMEDVSDTVETAIVKAPPLIIRDDLCYTITKRTEYFVSL